MQGRIDEAIAQYQQAVEIKPDVAAAHDNLGLALADRSRFDEAIIQYREALKIQPRDAEAHYNLGNVLATQGRYDEALTRYREALKIQPDHAMALSGLAWLRATCPVASLRSAGEAMEFAQRANQFCGGRRPDVLDTLAAAYAEAGWFPEALATASKALELATQQNKYALTNALRARMALYQAGKPYRQTPSVSAPPR